MTDINKLSPLGAVVFIIVLVYLWTNFFAPELKESFGNDISSGIIDNGTEALEIAKEGAEDTYDIQKKRGILMKLVGLGIFGIILVVFILLFIFVI